MSPLWTAETLPPRLVELHSRPGGTSLIGLANILNAYDADQERLRESVKPLRYHEAQLLAAIQLEGGDWPPGRAAKFFAKPGVTPFKNPSPGWAALQMKNLAERGYLVRTTPRSFTYRLPEEGESAC